MSMADRLKHARVTAGFKTAAAAIEHFNWPSSSYRAHENGQNDYGPEAASKYGKAYGVSAAWLLLGDNNNVETPRAKAAIHKHDCFEQIQAATLLLKSDPKNMDLINMLDSCVASLRAKASRR